MKLAVCTHFLRVSQLVEEINWSEKHFLLVVFHHQLIFFVAHNYYKGRSICNINLISNKCLQTKDWLVFGSICFENLKN